MTEPRVSILLPCFNDGAFIDDAIASVLAQTCQSVEVIVVDDGSTDPATLGRLASYRSPAIRVLRTAHRGLPAARNHAARHASGGVFCALDADDRLAPSWLEKGLRVLDDRPGVAFVSHWLETFGDERWTWTPETCDLPALLARNTVNGAALVRREAFEAVGGYDESMREGCEDWDFWLRLVERGWAGEIIPEVLFHYRRRAESMSRLMLQQDAYRRPLDVLVEKHEAAYRDHLIDVVVLKEREALHLGREVADLEQDRLTELEPALRRAREDLAAVARKVATVRQAVERDEELLRLRAGRQAIEREADALRVAVEHARGEIDALRTSWSWRVSAPLRTLYGLLVRRTP